MSGPTRWRDAEGGAPPEIRDFLRESGRTRPMTARDRTRLEPRVAKAMAVSVPGALAWLWGKGLAVAASVGVASVLVVSGAVALRRTPASAPVSASVSSVPPPVSRAARTAGVGARRTLAPSVVPTLAPAPAAVSALRTAIAASPVRAASPMAPVPVRATTMSARVLGVAPRGTAPARVAAAARPGVAVAPAEVGADAAAHAPGMGAPAVPAPEPAPVANPLLREVMLLDRARAVLASDPAEALRRVDLAAAEFPHGQLRDERDAVAIEALVRLGRRDEARARAAVLLARAPRSLHADRLHALLEAGH